MSAKGGICTCEPESAIRRRSGPAAISLCHFTVAHTQLKSRTYHRTCFPLAGQGADVTYIAPMPPVAGAAIQFVSLPRRRSRVTRALGSLGLLRELIRAEADLYHFQDPELLPLAIALKLAFRKRILYDAYEDFPSMARESQSIPHLLRPLASVLLKAVESVAARCFDGIVTADPFTLRRFARVGASRKLVLHNFPNLDFFPAPCLGPKPFDLVYRGGLSERAGTYTLLDAMHILMGRALAPRLLLIGYFDSTAAEAKLRTRIRELGLESRVEIRGRIAHAEMAHALGQARIGICPLRETAKFRLNIPVKVFEYWACGLPVVASDLPPIRPYLRTARAGLLFRAGSADDLASSIAWLLDHPVAATKMGENGRSAVVERFNNGAEIRKLERLLTQLIPHSCANARGRAPSCSNLS